MPEATETNTETVETQTQTTVKPEDHAKVLSDLQKIRQENEALKNEKATAEQKRLAETNDFKSLYEQEKTARTELKTKYEKLKGNVEYNEKFKAVQTALVTAGVKAEALKILEKETLSEVIVEKTSEGRMLVQGVDLYVDKFKKDYAFAFDTKKVDKINGGGGSGGTESSGDMTAAKLFEIEKSKGTKSPEYLSALEQYRKIKLKGKVS